MRRALQPAVAVLLAGGIAWGAAFTGFDHDARRVAAEPPHADGIVALTGGADRIDTALRLLEQGKAPRLLISGVGRGSDLPEIARRAQLDPAELGGTVELGRAATSTRGNAAEIADWARAHAVKSLIVVTAGYHMPRALLEIARRIPQTTLYPVPVRPPALRGVPDATTLRLLANEYDKYLAVRLGFADLVRKAAVR